LSPPPPPPPWPDFGIKTMGETGSKTSISHREGTTDHPSKDTIECGWQPVIRKVQPEENNLPPHPKNKKKQTNRKSNRHYTSSCCILATEVSNLCIVYYYKQKLDSQET
jgi:hypothetical protein